MEKIFRPVQLEWRTFNSSGTGKTRRVRARKLISPLAMNQSVSCIDDEVLRDLIEALNRFGPDMRSVACGGLGTDYAAAGENDNARCDVRRALPCSLIARSKADKSSRSH
jgi:hypothetical protein